MEKTGKIILASLVTAVMTGIIFGYMFTAMGTHKNAEMAVNDVIMREAQDTLMDYLGMSKDSEYALEPMHIKGEHDECCGEVPMVRMTQRVTVATDDGILPISGTVTKVQDSFYPGTYELKFSNNAFLTDTAKVQVRINVNKGDTVYILTGDKNIGYTQVSEVNACSDNCVVFDAGVICDYTISTTDIEKAQETMTSIASHKY